MMSPKRNFTQQDAKRIGDSLGINCEEVRIEEFLAGLGVELEHGARDLETNVTNDDEIQTGKIALAHLREFPDYYTRLARMEHEADEYWGKK
jgi:hypothetical protein